MKVAFSSRSWDDFRWHHGRNPKLFDRLLALIEDVRRSPFRGIGKPEPLREEWSGWWSRRLDDEHRFVYRVAGKGAEQQLQIAQCRYHY